MRISDWRSDVCSSDLAAGKALGHRRGRAMTEPILEVDDLVVEYGGRAAVRAVDGVSLRIAPREVLALVGESGCGKSSTARAVVGMERPHSGTVSSGERRGGKEWCR